MTKIEKNIIIAISVIALVVGGFAVYKASSTTKSGAGDVVQEYPSFFVNGINIGSRFIQEARLNLGDAQNQASWKNTTGQTVYARDFVANLVGSAKLASPVASTSMNLFVGTSSTATVTDSATPVSGILIDTYVIATSSTASIAINSFKDGGSAGRQVVPVKPGEYLIEVMESASSTGAGTSYEAPTSTNRGFNLVSNFLYTYSNN